MRSSEARGRRRYDNFYKRLRPTKDLLKDFFEYFKASNSDNYNV